jgi:N-acetylglucosaminyl-diphospho-decaprenol L-rhamnosyltransferase
MRLPLLTSEQGVDVVTVTYRSAETLLGSVEVLAQEPAVRVIVVDNASDDSTRELLSTLPVEVIALAVNGGFAHGCNVGVAAGSAPYVLLLNPDARIDHDALQALVAELQRDERAGAAAPRIVESDGTLQFSLRRFPRLRSTFAQAFFLHRLLPDASWVDEVIRERDAYERAHAVEWVSGACLLVRRSVIEHVGGLDESFFHYSEDVDLCARIWAAGYDVRFVPSASASHEGGASAPRTGLLPILAASRIRYSAKHDRRTTVPLVRLGVALGALTHAILARGGWPSRRGHLRALAVALQPLPSEPSRLVRGS